MSNFDPTPATRIPSTVQPPAPKAPWFKRKGVLIPVAAGVLGLAIGAAGGGKSDAATTPTPAPVETRTVTVPGPVETKEVTKTVNVPTPITPPACLQYIDLTEQAFDYSSDAMTAASEFDMVAMEKASDGLAGLVASVNKSKAECRAAK